MKKHKEIDWWREIPISQQRLLSLSFFGKREYKMITSEIIEIYRYINFYIKEINMKVSKKQPKRRRLSYRSIASSSPIENAKIQRDKKTIAKLIAKGKFKLVSV